MRLDVHLWSHASTGDSVRNMPRFAVTRFSQTLCKRRYFAAFTYSTICLHSGIGHTKRIVRPQDQGLAQIEIVKQIPVTAFSRYCLSTSWPIKRLWLTITRLLPDYAFTKSRKYLLPENRSKHPLISIAQPRLTYIHPLPSIGSRLLTRQQPSPTNT